VTYPKRIPPKATNKPTMMAGAAEPATDSGFLSIRPMVEKGFYQNEKDCTVIAKSIEEID